MADAEYHDDKGKVTGQPGFKKPMPGIEGPVLKDQANDTLSTVTGQAKETLSAATDQVKDAVNTVSGQARETLRSVSDRAPEMVDDLSRRGADYYRQGRRAVSNADSTTLASMFIAGTIGFGIGWLVFGQKSYSGDYVARRMSDSSDRRY
jgi:ElaB/YqjD/DUF883 family membrane-anchored ribosome-binding protein